MPSTRKNPAFYINKLDRIQLAFDKKQKEASASATEDIEALTTIIYEFTGVRLHISNLLNHPNQHFILSQDRYTTLENVEKSFSTLIANTIQAVLKEFSLSIMKETLLIHNASSGIAKAINCMHHISTIDGLLKTAQGLISALGQRHDFSSAFDTFNQICTSTSSYVKNVLTHKIVNLQHFNDRLITSIYDLSILKQNINDIQVLLNEWQLFGNKFKLAHNQAVREAIHDRYTSAVLTFHSLDWNNPLSNCIQDHIDALQKSSPSPSKKTLKKLQTAYNVFLKKVDLVAAIIAQKEDIMQTSPLVETLQTVKAIIKNQHYYSELTLQKLKRNSIDLRITLLTKTTIHTPLPLYLNRLAECKALLDHTTIIPRP